MTASLDASHLRREIRTALELALAATAPSSILDQLAMSAGYLEGLSEFPGDNPIVTALITRVEPNARASLRAWEEWAAQHLPQKS